MCLDSLFEIFGNPCIQGPVAAADDVYIPGGAVPADIIFTLICLFERFQAGRACLAMKISEYVFPVMFLADGTQNAN